MCCSDDHSLEFEEPVLIDSVTCSSSPYSAQSYSFSQMEVQLETETAKKAPKPRKKHCKTIEQNVNNLNVSSADLKCEVRNCVPSVVSD